MIYQLLIKLYAYAKFIETECRPNAHKLLGYELNADQSLAAWNAYVQRRAFRYTLFRFFKRYCSLCTGNFVVVSSAAAPAGLKPRRKVGPPEESTNFHRWEKIEIAICRRALSVFSCAIKKTSQLFSQNTDKIKQCSI
jgi:hypothetical protein